MHSAFKNMPINVNFEVYTVYFLILWFVLTSNNMADMAAVYYENIDVEGHHFGPRSEQVRTAVHSLDMAIQTLNRKIKV